MAGPVQTQDPAGVIRAGQMGQAALPVVEQSLTDSGGSQDVTNVGGATTTLIAEAEAMASEASQYQDGLGSWALVSGQEPQFASDFGNLESACGVAGVAIGGGDASNAGGASPGMTTSAVPQAQDTYPASAGCPSSAQLLAAWNAAPASVQDTWISGLTPTGFFATTCWGSWVASNAVVQANGYVVFSDTSGQLALMPQSEMGEFNDAVCGVPDARAAWAGPAGPAFCSQGS